MPNTAYTTMLAPGSQIGKYVLGKKLGQGGFGVVFRARDASLDREVALKFLHPEHSATPQILQRFLQEARSAARIQHPGIVTVYECGQLAEAGNAAYIAMELLDGESLTDRLSRSGRFASDEAMEVARQIASALEAAHRAGIVHRDLKPDNVFLVKDPAVHNGERIKVLDFGIAKLGRTASSSIQTQSMMVFGTPRYMSPEQCKSAANVDARSDIYTLGCILFELVCGRPPFEGTPGDLIARHVLVDPPSIAAIEPGVPPALDRLIAAMLAKDPDDRPETMAAVQRALESGGAMSPGVAPTLLPGALPPARRTPAAVATASPTTLGSAARSSQVRDAASTGRRKRIAAVVAGAAIAVAATVTLWIVARPDEPAIQTAAAPLDSNPAVPPAPPAAASASPTDEAVAIEDIVLEPAEPPAKPPQRLPSPTPVKVPGMLSVVATPACAVQIDDAGRFQTPIRGLKLAAGRHKITLSYPPLDVSDSVWVDIAPGAAKQITRDYTDRSPPPAPPPLPKNRDRTIDPTQHKTDAKPPDADPKHKDKTINPFSKPDPKP